MNREILFRGLTTDGKWIEGYYCTNSSGKHYIVKEVWFTDVVSFEFIEVIPSTVGEYTGLKDKAGKKIFEGDILKIKTQSGRVENFTVVFGVHRREMKSGWTVDIPSFSFVNSEGFPTFPIVNNYMNGHDLDIIEIIGSIHTPNRG